MDEPTPSRRGFLKGAVAGGTAAAVTVTPLAGLAQAAAATVKSADAPAGYMFLMPTEAAFIEAVADHMYPPGPNSPGGVDIGINTFIDRALAGSWGKGDRALHGRPVASRRAVTGLPAAADAGAAVPARHCQHHHRLPEEVRQALRPAAHRAEGGSTERPGQRCDAVADGLPSRSFFDALYQCVVQGIFADPIYGGNKDMAGWKLIGFPGVVATHAKNIVDYNNKPFPVKYLGIADMA